MSTDFPHVREAITGTFLRHGYMINCPYTCYVDLGIESRWVRDFLYPFTPALGSTQPPVQRVVGLFPGR